MKEIIPDTPESKLGAEIWYSLQVSFWEWDQSMRDDVTIVTSLIAWANTQNDTLS